MIVTVVIHHLAVCAVACSRYLADAAGNPSPGAPPPGPIDNPGPQSPLGSSNGVDLLLSYAKFGAVIACGVAAVISGGLMAFGSLSNRPDHVDRGKRALLWSLAGVAVAALGIPVANTIFGAAR
jgi:hypothetical protein